MKGRDRFAQNRGDAPSPSRAPRAFFILPRGAGKGGRAAQQRGGRGTGGKANLFAARLPPRFAGGE